MGFQYEKEVSMYSGYSQLKFRCKTLAETGVAIFMRLQLNPEHTEMKMADAPEAAVGS